MMSLERPLLRARKLFCLRSAKQRAKLLCRPEPTDYYATGCVPADQGRLVPALAGAAFLG